MLMFDDLKISSLRGDLEPFTPQMKAAVKGCNEKFPSGLCMITEGSPLRYMKVVETLGYCWKRELKYDFPPFTVFEYRKRNLDGTLIYREMVDGKREGTDDTNTRSFMWVDGTAGKWQPIGAITFRLLKKYWWLMWVWFHPDHRRNGHLTAAWPFFLSMFGVFVPQLPLSGSFARFLRKVKFDETIKPFLSKNKTSQ